MPDAPPELFRTERLIARRIDARDVDAMARVYGDAEAMRWVDGGEPLPREGCVEWVAVTERNYAVRGYGMSAVVLRETGAIIGFCGIVHPGGQPEPEIKYAFLREHWGRGFATETVKGMLAWGLAAQGLARVIATTAPENKASHRVLEKAGMTDLETRTDDDGSATRVFVWHGAAADAAGD